MAVLDHKSRLTKELNLFHVYALATGATLSSGLFLLPGLAARDVGPAVVVAYMLAAVPLIPAMFSMIELATAMPRAGGAYYFLDRSLGPMAGTIGGLGTWLALTLKTAFALVGMGAYLMLFFPEAPYKLVACGFALVFGALNVLGSGRSGRVQVIFVLLLLAILIWFVVRGSVEVDFARFEGFMAAALDENIIATAGVVYISYVGVTKVASVSEEVQRPDRNLPLGLLLALGTAVVIYGLSIFVMTGTIPAETFAGSLTPMAEAARTFGGQTGVVVISIAALLAFSSVSNAGILSASRYPLAMSRDHILPRRLGRLSGRRTPVTAIIITVVAIVLAVLLLDPLKIAKLASAFQLLMFALLCGAVIVMRESKIDSYDPGYRSPFYPWMQIVGMVAPLVLIGEMGWLPILFSTGLVVVGLAWYFGYARKRTVRGGAIFHVFERLGRRRFEDLDGELRGILKEKGLREADPFVEVVARSLVLDVDDDESFEEIAGRVSRLLAPRVSVAEVTLTRMFLEGTRIGATPVAKGAALPHMRVPGIDTPSMVLVRSRGGIAIDTGNVLGETLATSNSYAVFFLVSPESDPGQHLRLLAELASRVDQPDFLTAWQEASDEQRLKQVLLRHERYALLKLRPGEPTHTLIDLSIREIRLPAGCLIAVIRRGGESVVPGGDTVLREEDRLTIIGSEAAVSACNERFGSEGPGEVGEAG